MAESIQDEQDLNHVAVAVLGVLTICAYGSWYYAFGVLLDPIIDDTGWRESTLTASFAVGTIAVGLGAIFGGRIVDLIGHRRVFAVAGVLSAASLAVASMASGIAMFFVSTVAASAVLGALGFYHVTMTTVVRINPDDPTRAIAHLTIWGAFASVIYLPAAAWIESAVGWRATLRIIAAVVGVAFVVAALVLPDVAAQPREDRTPLRQVVREIGASPTARWFATALALYGIAMSTVLAYQVPAMSAAGLTAGAAATMAGLRGMCQLLGRLPLAGIVRRLGETRSLMLAFVSLSVGGLVLTVAGSVALAGVFAVLAGFGIGAHSPLQGMMSEALFERDNLGATMGFFGALGLLVGAIGPALTGVLVDTTGSRGWAGVVIALSAAAATAALAMMQRISRD